MWQAAMRLEIPDWVSLGRSRYWPEEDPVPPGIPRSLEASKPSRSSRTRNRTNNPSLLEYLNKVFL